MYDGFSEIKTFVQGRGGDLLQPESASELKVLVKLMEDSQERALEVMKEWTLSLGGAFKPGPLKHADRMVAKARADYGGDLRRILVS